MVSVRATQRDVFVVPRAVSSRPVSFSTRGDDWARCNVEFVEITLRALNPTVACVAAPRGGTRLSMRRGAAATISAEALHSRCG